MPATTVQWIWFAFYTVGSFGGWLSLAAFVLISKRAHEAQRQTVRIDQ